MKSEPKFDPRDYDYGAASDAVRSIFAEWLEIDWFDPSAVTAEHAVSFFREHQRLAHTFDPDMSPSEIDLRIVTGNRDEFASWWQRVSHTSWD